MKVPAVERVQVASANRIAEMIKALGSANRP
jgi:hypothetical protein